MKSQIKCINAVSEGFADGLCILIKIAFSKYFFFYKSTSQNNLTLN